MHKYFVAPLVLLGLTLAVARSDEQPAKKPAADLLPRVSLGMTVEEMAPENPFGGVIVREVTEGGPAAKAGIQKGDLIIRVGNRQVDDFDQLLNVIAGHKPGDQVSFTVVRDDERKKVKVTLGEPQEQEAKPPKGARSCAYLGALAIPLGALSDETLDRLGIMGQQGVVIMDVVPGSPAAKAGLRHGDLIRSLDGKEVRDPDNLRTAIHRAGAGKEITLQVQRGESTKEIKATLASGPCDVHLIPSPEGFFDLAPARTLERLERRLERLEKRLQELEGKASRVPKK